MPGFTVSLATIPSIRPSCWSMGPGGPVLIDRSGRQAHAAGPPAEEVEQTGQRLGVADLASGDHALEVAPREGPHLLDGLALVEALLAAHETGRHEQMHALVVAAGHRVPLGELLEARGLVPRLLDQLARRADLGCLQGNGPAVLLPRVDRSRRQLPEVAA